MDKTTKSNGKVNRRTFLAGGAAAGAGLALSGASLAQASPGDVPGGTVAAKPAGLNVAVIGTGTQGRVLLANCMKIPGLSFKAVCDIWAYSQKYASRRLKKRGHDVNVYADYKEMLAKEKQLDAVIVATPDWMHAEHTIACLKAGKHVYCEKEMSNDIEKARSMVVAAKETGKLLQIGHQRRSNPRYIHALEKVINEAKLLGRITHATGQWNRAARPDLGWPKKDEVDAATLKRFGYKDMHQFRNWRWYKKYGGGPIVDLGSHQIDVFSWFLGTNPKNVMASGGLDYYKNHEWPDNVMAIFEYATDQGTVRAYYQVLTTSSARGYLEGFLGDAATLQISESPSKIRIFAEAHTNAEETWEKWVKKGYIMRLKEDKPAEEKKKTPEDAIIEVYKSLPPVTFIMPVDFQKSYHQPHLENFFAAVRGKAKLTCPAEVGFESAAVVLKVNEAVGAGKRLDFTKADFKA